MDHQNTADTQPTDDPPWASFFGFAEPYENQCDAIDAAIQAGQQNGYLVMEGPCGTGKTMAALTAAAYLLRSTEAYDNVLVVTPVKQQLHQFVADLRTINESVSTPLAGVGLVGKPDLCPYEREDSFPDDVGVHTRCEDLRETTAELVETRAKSSSPREHEPPNAPRSVVPGAREGTDKWWDPHRARDLVHAARLDAGRARSRDAALRTAGEASPYPAAQPAVPEELEGPAIETDSVYCPFEADWYARDKGSPVGFDHGENHVVTIDEYLPLAVSHGTCPHRVMTVLLENAEVVIGNYNHLFDPRTRPLTESILSDRTFVIVDEAHRLEERVRSLLSTTIGQHTLRRARQDCNLLRNYASRNQRHREQTDAHLEDFNVKYGDVTRVNQFYDDVLDWLHSRIETELTRHPELTPQRIADTENPDDTVEIPLRDPTSTERDDLTNWAIATGYDETFRESIATTGHAVEQALDTIDPDRSCVATAVGAVFQSWFESDHATYFREIELELSSTPTPAPEASWEDTYTPRLVMYNCLPSPALASIFDSLGGGILMSATLEPLDIFKRVSGLTELEDRSPSRPIIDRTYDLPFPRENRATWIVDATPFTARNRGDPTESPRNETRDEYLRVLIDIARSPGNVMLCLPSYAEAAWAASTVREEIGKPVLLDRSTSSEDTEVLKQEFFRSDAAVLITSSRGTLTEGIDYDTDKLRTCAVIGIPLVNIGSPRVQAVRHAYGSTFGERNAFEYALTIPAVRRARQAIGRVIRGPDESGVRILVDKRYTTAGVYNSVQQYFPETTRDEFVRMTPMFLQSQITDFWEPT